MTMRDQAGYSLVELLVVLALLGLIAIAISGGMSFGARVWERTESEVARVETARGGHAYLRNLLSHVYPRVANEGQGLAFAGSRDGVTFLSLPATGDSAGVARMTLRLLRDGAGLSLVLEQANERGIGDKREDVLLRDAREVQFAYGEVTGGAIAWSDNWRDRSQLPTLIRVRIVFRDARGRWPDLVVRPRIARPANCIYDAVSFACRNG